MIKKLKRVLSVRILIDDFNNYFDSDFNSFNLRESKFKEINTKIAEGIYKFENGIKFTTEKKKM